MRPLLPPLLLAIAISAAGCANNASEFMREPYFSPVGSGLVTEETASIQTARVLTPPPLTGPPPSLYSQPRIAHVGDIVRVLISINDKASLGNASGRSQTTKDGVVVDFGYNNGSSASSSNQPAKLLGDLSSPPQPKGKATLIDPSKFRCRWRPLSPASFLTAISSSQDRRKCASTTSCANSPSREL